MRVNVGLRFSNTCWPACLSLGDRLLIAYCLSCLCFFLEVMQYPPRLLSFLSTRDTLTFIVSAHLDLSLRV